MKKSLVVVIGLLLLFGGGLRLRLVAREPVNHEGQAESKADPAHRRATRDAAKKAQELSMKAFSSGLSSLAETAAWSRRWLEAERGLANDKHGAILALQEYVQRTKQLRDLAHKMHAAGLIKELDAVAADFYVAEAESWLAAAGGAVKKTAAGAHPRQARAMIETAKETYAVTWAAYADETEVFASVYTWSVRWLEAERALADTKESELAALRRHWERTQEWNNDVKPKYEVGARGGEAPKYRAAQFYMAEAEFWLVAAGGETPDK